jgi:hypothetical protein
LGLPPQKEIPIISFWKIPAQILLSILCVFLSLEATTRLYYFGLAGFNPLTMNSFGGIGRSALIQASEDPEISYELRPNLDTYFKMARFTTNSQGFRDKEYSLSKPPLTFRVAVVGGSFVMGSGVELEETFHSELENRLNREKKGVTYEFINMGVNGYSPWRSLAMLKSKALAYDPDLILFAPWHSWDAEDRARLRAGTRRRILPAHPAFFDSYFWELVKLRIRAWRNESKGKEKAARRVDMEKFHKHVNEVFSELGEIQRKTGIPICIVFLQHRDKSLYLVKEMEAPARRYGLPLIDTTEPFIRAGFPDNCAHPLDCHPNARAHRIFADVIYDFLMRNHLLETTGKRTNRDL